MAVNRKLLQQALQQAGQIQDRAISGQGFDPRGGPGVAIAQIATAGIGAFAQNRAAKQLAEIEQQEQQSFAQQFPQFAGLAGQTSAATRQSAIQAQLSGQIAQQFAEPKKATPFSPRAKVAADIQAGFLPEGTSLTPPVKAKEDSFTIKQTDQGLIRINTRTGESFPVTSEGGEPTGVPIPKAPEKKPLSGESAKLLTISTGGINALNELNTLLGEDGTVSFRSEVAPERLKTPRGRQITLLRKDLADSIGRLRSGGAINEDELVTFNSFIPSRTDDAETTQFKMKKLGEKFSTLQAGITGQEVPQAELNLGSSDPKAAALAELKKRGLL